MFIKHGSTRTVVCFPLFGIVVKFPRSCLGDFGIKANIAEAYLWEKTRNPLLAPVLFSFFGWIVVIPYYPKAVKLGKHIDGHLPKEVKVELIKQTFYPLTEKILGKHIRHFFIDGHNVMGSNFRLTKSGKLAMTDYGITAKDEQEMFVKFLNEYGAKLVAEYAEPPL